MGCQTATALAVITLGTDHVLALKENQPTFRDKARPAFADTRAAVRTSRTPSASTIGGALGFLSEKSTNDSGTAPHLPDPATTES